MKLTEIPRLFSPTRWAIVGAIALIAICAILYVLTEPGRANQRAAEAKAAGAYSAARTSSASDAGKILDQAHSAIAASEQLSRETADAIQRAPGADQRLDPDLNRVARERVCQRPSYRDTAECVLLLGGREPPR